jgi:hypothetical protein
VAGGASPPAGAKLKLRSRIREGRFGGRRKVGEGGDRVQIDTGDQLNDTASQSEAQCQFALETDYLFLFTFSLAVSAAVLGNRIVFTKAGALS